jgi:hypothetical protein
MLEWTNLAAADLAGVLHLPADLAAAIAIAAGNLALALVPFPSLSLSLSLLVEM